MNTYLMTTGLAIFSMLFGAGNLIYPLLVGISSGRLTWLGMIGFLLTGALLPLCGLVTMILYDGNYNAFFGRLGKIAGQFTIFACMMIIGPVVAIPRIASLSQVMIAPFLPFIQDSNVINSFIFSVIFLGVTFLMTYRESKIIQVLGNFISPALLVSLFIIIIRGLITADSIVPATNDTFTIFFSNFLRGYETLDLIGAIFFASIIISLLKQQSHGAVSLKKLCTMGLKAGIIGTALLCIVYIGMSSLSMWHGHDLTTLSAGSLFREISFRILGQHGAIIIAMAVLMACLSTSIALSAVVAEYIQHTVCYNRISYTNALLLTVILSLPLSTFGLEKVLELTGGPIVYIGYPIIIALTLCNLAYKLVGFTPVKIPVLLTGLASFGWYFKDYFIDYITIL